MNKLIVEKSCDTEGCLNRPTRLCARCGRDICSDHGVNVNISSSFRVIREGYCCTSCSMMSIRSLIDNPVLLGKPVNIIIPAELPQLKHELESLCAFTIGPIDVDEFLKSVSVIVNKFLEYRRLVNGLHSRPDDASGGIQ